MFEFEAWMMLKVFLYSKSIKEIDSEEDEEMLGWKKKTLDRKI